MMFSEVPVGTLFYHRRDSEAERKTVLCVRIRKYPPSVTIAQVTEIRDGNRFCLLSDQEVDINLRFDQRGNLVLEF